MDNDPVISPYFSVQQNFQNLSVQYPPVGRARQHYYSESAAGPPSRRNSVGGDLSDRISKLIADNNSIVGEKAQPSSKPSDRKRVTKGPWRYEERIQQLGYQPNSGHPRQPSKVRRNSLPVHPLGFNREILRPYPVHDFPQPRSVTRRASLPTAPALVMSQKSPQNCEISWRVNMSSFSQQARPSVICENPIYRSNKKEQEKQAEEPMNVDSKSDDEEVDIIVVDEEDPPMQAYKNHILPSIVTPIDHPMSVIKSIPPVSSEDDPSLAFGETSSVIKPTTTITNANKTAGINAEVISALQEVEYRAKKTAENCGTSENRQDTGTVNFVGDGAARKPVLFNPIPDVDANTAAAVQDAEIDSDDEDTRPYKCTHCNKGFRISGHLARHMKSDTHLRRMQELVEIQGGPMFEAQQRRRFNDDATQFDEMQENPHSSAMQLPMPLAVQPPVSFNPAALQGHLDRHKRSTAHISMLEAGASAAQRSDIDSPPLQQQQIQRALEANAAASLFSQFGYLPWAAPPIQRTPPSSSFGFVNHIDPPSPSSP